MVIASVGADAWAFESVGPGAARSRTLGMDWGTAGAVPAVVVVGHGGVGVGATSVGDEVRSITTSSRSSLSFPASSITASSSSLSFSSLTLKPDETHNTDEQGRVQER